MCRLVISKFYLLLLFCIVCCLCGVINIYKMLVSLFFSLRELYHEVDQKVSCIIFSYNIAIDHHMPSSVRLPYV